MKVIEQVKSGSRKVVTGTKKVTGKAAHKVADPVVAVTVRRLAIHRFNREVKDQAATAGLALMASDRAHKEITKLFDPPKADQKVSA